MAKTYLDDFGGSLTPDTRTQPRLPSHRDFPNPLRDADLFDAHDPVIDQKLNRVEDERFLRYTYSRALHPVLDEFQDEDLEGFDPKGTFTALEHCHNGLWRARRAEFLEAPDVYHLANRLITWIQDQPGARLGGYGEGQWWIAPDAYVIKAGRISSSGFGAYRDMESIPKLADPMLAEIGIYGDRSEDKAQFERARFTVHFAHFVTTAVDHWGLMIRQRSTGNTWYIDSNPTSEVPRRSEKALKVFKSWLELSGIPDPPEAAHSVVKSKLQIDGWSCGLHVIANAAAFIRFEVLGWEKVPYWGRMDSRQMIKRLIKSLHNLMGLAVPAGFSPSPTSPPKRGRKSSDVGHAGPNVRLSGAPEPTPSPAKPSQSPRKGGQTREEPDRAAAVTPEGPAKAAHVGFGVRRAPRGRAVILAARAAEAAEAAARRYRRGKLAAATPEVADSRTASVKKVITRSAAATRTNFFPGTEHPGDAESPRKKKTKTVSFSNNEKSPPSRKRSTPPTEEPRPKAKKQKKTAAAARPQGIANPPPTTAKNIYTTRATKRGSAVPSASVINEAGPTATATAEKTNLTRSSTKPDETAEPQPAERAARRGRATRATPPATATQAGAARTTAARRRSRKRERASGGGGAGAEGQGHEAMPVPGKRPTAKKTARDRQEAGEASPQTPSPSVWRGSSRLRTRRKVLDDGEREAAGGDGEPAGRGKRRKVGN